MVKNEKGVSLIALVITIIVVLILAFIMFGSSTKTITNANYSNYVNNVREVQHAFDVTVSHVKGVETAKGINITDAQVYHYVAKNGKNSEDFLAKKDLPDYTVIQDKEQIGIKLPKMKIESGTGKMVNVQYAVSSEGVVFTWPPFDYENGLKINAKDTVENKMSEIITVGEETFGITLDKETGLLAEDAVHHTIIFDANGGYVSNEIRAVEIGEMLGELPVPIKDGSIFDGWYTQADGGTVVTSNTIVEKLGVTYYAHWTQAIAEMDGIYYTTLQSAIDKVPNNNTSKTIKLWKDISEKVTIARNKYVVFDLQNYTISNNGETQVITNNGTVVISNGTITSSAAYAAIDNESTGSLIINGGRILATGERGAIYNNRGMVEISGTAYLSATALHRATIQNQSSARLFITGGTVVSVNHQAVSSSGEMTIGIEDGNVNVTSPVLQGATLGVTSTSDFNFYNGIIRGVTGSINNDTKVVGKETGYDVVHGAEIIGGVAYQTAYLAHANRITFNANEGTVNETTRLVEVGKAIGTLPVATRTEFDFMGWYTAPENGEEITAATVLSSNMECYAHWKEIFIAEIEGTTYKTLQEAVNAVPTDKTQTTIKLLRDTATNITISVGKNIVLNLQSYTISNRSGSAVISNNGTLSISNGTITTASSSVAAINNNEKGILTISGGRIIATGGRQALYNDRGVAEITGNAYLSATTGERAAVHNLASGKMTITGGTIVSTSQYAISNSGDLIIGTENGNVVTTSPVLQGTIYGVMSESDFSFYDGVIKGITAAINDETKVNDIETGYMIQHGTEVISGTTYKTAYLSH